MLSLVLTRLKDSPTLPLDLNLKHGSQQDTMLVKHGHLMVDLNYSRQQTGLKTSPSTCRRSQNPHSAEHFFLWVT
jgi:hypothetical protein